MMKKFRKISALILTLALLATSLMTGGIVSSAAENLPETNVNLTATGGWPNFKDAVHDHSYESKNVECFQAETGIVSKNYPDAYVVYRVEKNSPFIANFKLFTEATDGKPVFYVSQDGINYTEYEMNSIITGSEEDDNLGNINYVTYYTNGIGENNKYVKIVICDKSTDGIYFFCDLRSLSYNANTEADETFDTNFVYSDWSMWYEGSPAVTDIFESKNNVMDPANGGMFGSNGMDSYLVYRVKENSAVSATFKRWGESGKPAFYASADGINWTNITSKETVNGERYTYYRDCIGEGNKYWKIVFSTTENASSKSALQNVSYNANTEEDKTFDTNFVYSDWSMWYEGSPAVTDIFESKNNAMDPANGGMFGSNGMDSYLVYRVKENSAVSATFKRWGESGKPAFYASADGINWTNITSKETVNGERYTYYRDCIGEGNKYWKIVFSTTENASSKSALQNVSYNANTEEKATFDVTFDYHRGDGLVDEGSTTAWQEYAHTVSNVNTANDSNCGLIGTNGTDSYIVYKVQENSAISACFKQQPGYAPVFYVSADGIDWIAVGMQKTASSEFYTYYRDCIGKGNKYVKIVLSTANGASWQCDMKYFSCNFLSATDTKLDFLNNYSACVDKLNTPSLIDKQNITNYGGVGLVGENTPDAYIVYKVQDNSPIKANFKMTATASPAFYASADGFNWTQLDMKLFSLGAQKFTYFIDGIGVGNRYFKVQVSTTQLGNNGGNLWEVDLHELYFNKNTVDTLANEKFDTVLNFVGEYNDVFLPALSKSTAHNEIIHNVGGDGTPLGMIGTKGINSYVVYEVEKNSAISAKFKLAENHTPSFFVSNDGKEWTKIGMEVIGSTYYRECIGAENKYVKIVFSEVEGAHWMSELREFSYNLVDPSGDGKVNSADLVLVRKILFGAIEGEGFDFNRDGEEDIIDLVALKKYLL